MTLKSIHSLILALLSLRANNRRDSLQAQESLSAAEAAKRARHELKVEEDKAKATLVRRDDVFFVQSYVYWNRLEDTVKAAFMRPNSLSATKLISCLVRVLRAVEYTPVGDCLWSVSIVKRSLYFRSVLFQPAGLSRSSDPPHARVVCRRLNWRCRCRLLVRLETLTLSPPPLVICFFTCCLSGA